MRPSLKAAVDNAINQYHTALKSVEESGKLLEVRKHFELLRDLLHRDNVPRLLLEGVRGDLNNKLSEYVNMFDLPYELDWTADGDLLYKPLNSDWCSTRMLSGGQKYILMLSLRCSFAELLNSVFPVLVLDEPTTGLDTVNRGLLAETLLSISDTLCTRGMSLLIPTHDETIIQNAQNIIKIGE
jgi:DNA repair exonuclease SbcCD ATPase subunit